MNDCPRFFARGDRERAAGMRETVELGGVSSQVGAIGGGGIDIPAIAAAGAIETVGEIETAVGERLGINGFSAGGSLALAGARTEEIAASRSNSATSLDDATWPSVAFSISAPITPTFGKRAPGSTCSAPIATAASSTTHGASSG